MHYTFVNNAYPCQNFQNIFGVIILLTEDVSFPMNKLSMQSRLFLRWFSDGNTIRKSCFSSSSVSDELILSSEFPLNESSLTLATDPE